MALPDWPAETRRRLDGVEAGLLAMKATTKLDADARQAIRLGLIQVEEARRMLGEAERGVLVASITFDRPGIAETSALVQAVGEAIYRGLAAAELLFQPWAHERYRFTSRRRIAGPAALKKANARKASTAKEKDTRIREMKRKRPDFTAGQIEVHYPLENNGELVSLDTIYRALGEKKKRRSSPDPIAPADQK